MPSHRRVAKPIDKRKALALAVGMDMGKEMVAYLEVMYFDVFEKMNSGCRLSIRNIRGTHVSVSRKHLAKYLGEFEFRYNLRHSPSVMMNRLLATF